MIEADESLTLDTAAMVRAAAALGTALDGRSHFCAEWDEGDGCTICWRTAADVVRAAEGLKCCSRCGGGGMVAPGDCCDLCGGHGLERSEGP